MERVLSDPDIGFLSLALCIFTTLTVDQALEEIAPDPDIDNRLLRRQEDEDLIKLKPGMSWGELGEIFNITSVAAFKRAKYYREHKERMV
jgi:hypothetical protein